MPSIPPNSESGGPATSFTFPCVLKSRSDRSGKRLCIADSDAIVARYWTEMYLGAEFERYVHSNENTNLPNTITYGNLSNARRIRAQGFSNESLRRFLERPLKELEEIPSDTDLFETKEYDGRAIALLCDLCMIDGVKAANATKILHQKRPRLIPILDQFARVAMNIPWHGKDSRADFAEMFRGAFAQVRTLENVAENKRTLSRIRELSAEICGGISLSRVRIIDILAWMVGGGFVQPGDCVSTQRTGKPPRLAAGRSAEQRPRKSEEQRAKERKRKARMAHISKIDAQIRGYRI